MRAPPHSFPFYACGCFYSESKYTWAFPCKRRLIHVHSTRVPGSNYIYKSFPVSNPCKRWLKHVHSTRVPGSNYIYTSFPVSDPCKRCLMLVHSVCVHVCILRHTRNFPLRFGYAVGTCSRTYIHTYIRTSILMWTILKHMHEYLRTCTHSELTCGLEQILEPILLYSHWSIANPIIIEGLFQFFQRFPSSILVIKAVESRYAVLNYSDIGNRVAELYECVLAYFAYHLPWKSDVQMYAYMHM